MGEKKFSSEQLAAINTRDRTLIVSAAAGSGKTTTLTERIIRSLLDDEKPTSISKMLIVTFTNASVADLKDKIARALKEAVAANPENTRLENELFALPTAHISTIDAFCSEVVRQNSEKIDVPSNYRLASDVEATVLSDSILDATVDLAYDGLIEGITPENMEELSDALTSSKTTSSLAEVLRMLYERSKSAINGVAIYRDLANKYLQNGDFSVEDTFFGAEVMKHAKSVLSYHVEELEAMAATVGFGDYAVAERNNYFITLREFGEALKIKSYEKMKAFLEQLEYPDLPRTPKAEKTEAIEFTRARRTKLKGSVAELYRKFFSYSTDDWHWLYKGLYRIISTLATLLESFDRSYVREKMRRAMLEHSDVERLAYKALYTSDGVPSEVALAYRDRFDSVYIDEYQDVNALQNAIFYAVSRDDNRFMVGDIKQSIYSFRSARPEIFSEMKNAFPPLEKSHTGSGASLFMSRNYRCDEGIVDFVNDVFGPMFSRLGGAVDYTSSDALKYAKDSDPKPEYYYPRISVYPKKPSSSDPERDLYAPRRVAREIALVLEKGKLDSGDPIRPSDVAIILRKNASITNYAEALRELGIKADTGPDRSFFLNPEVLLALCLLNAIDNPSKDVYLAGLMCSPLYGFTADDILKIRRSKKGGTLYSALKEYADIAEGGRISKFLKSLSHYRTVSEGMNVSSLILRLYKETGLLALASKNGGKENLMLLYSFARSYEGSSFCGLYSFIKHLNTVIELGTSFVEKRESDDPDAVKILTVHSSKGLEYPIVFFAEAGKPFLNLDARGRIAYAEDYGISVCLRSGGVGALVESPVQNIIIEKMNERYFEEELRVLYVALTRAKEKLFISGESPLENMDSYVSNAKFEKNLLSDHSKKRLGSYLDVILAAGTKATVLKHSENDDIPAPLTPCEETVEEEPEAREPDTSVSDILRDRFNYVYPDRIKTRLPEKMSVSRLYPTVLDGEEEVPLLIKDTASDPLPTLPSFITGREENESAKRGIATHTFLQFFDMTSLETQGAEAELSRLVHEGFISEDDSKRVRMSEIKMFCRSKLFSEMKNAKKLLREFRFTSRLPATLFTEDAEVRAALANEKILVQGVIDCIIENGDGSIILVDYKTDRLTKEELGNPALAKKKLNEKHSLQLSYYKEAIKTIFGKEPDKTEIYSLPLGDTVEIDTVL